VIAADATLALALQDALTDPLQRAGIAPEFVRERAVVPAMIIEPAGAQAADAELFLDLTRGNSAALLLTDRARTRVYARAFELPNGLDEVRLEEIVVAARSSLQAILMRLEVGQSRAEFQRALGVTVPRSRSQAAPRSGPRSQPPSHRRSLSSRYEATVLHESLIAHGPGLLLTFGRRAISLSAGVVVRLPHHFESDDIELRFTTLSPRLELQLQHDFGRVWRGAVMLGIAGEASYVEPRARGTRRARLPEPSWALDPSTRAAMAVSYGFERLRLGALAGLDVTLLRARYTIDVAGERRTFFQPWTLRPALGVTLSTPL
jgi:hypothetical protein